MAAQPTAAGWILRMGSTAGIVGALLGLVGNLLHPATPTGDPAGGPRHRRQPTLGPRSPRHGPRPDPRARRPDCHRPVHPRRPPRGLARLGSVAAVAGVTVGLNLVTSTAWPPSSSPRPGQLRHRRNKRPRCGWFWLRRPSTSPWRPGQHPVGRRDLHPLRPSRGLEPALPTLAGMGSGPGRSRLDSGRPDPGVGGRGHHGDQDPDHHLPHRHHLMVDPDGHTGVPQGAFNRRRHRWGALRRPLRPTVLDPPAGAADQRKPPGQQYNPR
jgi:hypothetical protein